MKSVSLAAALLTVSLSLYVSSADSAPAEGSVLRLTFLGTGAPRPSLERYGPSILIEAGEHRIIVDAGSGMRERLFEAGGFDLITGVDHVLVTHLHFDHTISIPGLWLSGWLYGRRVPFKIQGPSGTEAMMANFEEAYRWDIEYRDLVGVPLQGIELDVDDVSAGVIFDQDGLKITAFDVEHMPIDLETRERLDFRGETFGFRVDYKGRSVLFSGDTRPSENIVKHGQGVDVLIHEVQVPSPGSSKEAELANVSLSVHSTPEQAGGIFARTKPRMAIYSHIIPPGATAQDLIAATRPVYDGPLTVAHDLMMITIGEQIEIGERPRQGDETFEESSVLK